MCWMEVTCAGWRCSPAGQATSGVLPNRSGLRFLTCETKAGNLCVGLCGHQRGGRLGTRHTLQRVATVTWAHTGSLVQLCHWFHPGPSCDPHLRGDCFPWSLGSRECPCPCTSPSSAAWLSPGAGRIHVPLAPSPTHGVRGLQRGARRSPPTGAACPLCDPRTACPGPCAAHAGEELIVLDLVTR